MLKEDPLVSESLSFVREFFYNSSYVNNGKEIPNFFSSNWKYENHGMYVENIFSIKNYQNLKINFFNIIINHNETESKSFKHDIEGTWKILIFEKI